MTRRKCMVMALAGIMTTASLAGCSSSSSSQTSGTTAANQASGTTAADQTQNNTEEKIVIKVTRWGEADVEKQLAEEFNKTNDKNIEVVVDAIPGDGYGDRLTTSFSGGDGYDIFLSGEGDFTKWVDLGMIEPLGTYIENDKDWNNPMSDSIMNMGVVGDDQSYLIKDYNPMCLWYNKDMFDEAGVEYPSEDWTWDDLYAAAQKITSKDENGNVEKFGFMAQSWNYALACYLESNGLSYISEDLSTADGYLNSPKLAEALDTYFSWNEGDDRISPNAADTDTYGDANAMMINGKLAMFISGGWVMQALEDANVNYGTALVPGNHKAYFCASGYGISSKCKNKEAAWEVLKLITGEEASALRVEKEKVFPTSQTQLDKMIAEYKDNQKALLQSLDYSVSPIGMRGKLGYDISVVLGEALERIIYHDGATQDILNDAYAKLSEQE